MYVRAEPILIAGFGSRSPEVAAVLSGLTDVYSETGRYEKARQTGERALALLPDDSQLGATLFVLGKVAWSQHREADAEELLRRALEVWRQTLGPRHHTIASGLTSLAVVVSRKNSDEAGRLFRESLEMIETEFGSDHVLAGFVLTRYATHLEAIGSKREARSVKKRGEMILAAHARENRLGQTVDIKAFQRPNTR
jgi:tetratricopeptide (TPR) repeat protein